MRPASPTAFASDSRTESRLGCAVLWHVGGLVVLAAWALGGNAPWSRQLVQWWGTFGAALTVALLTSRWKSRETWRPRWLWAFVIFNALALLSALNPAFREVSIDQQPGFLPRPHWSFLPQSVQPAQALDTLWLFDVIYLSCFNLTLSVRRRRSLRWLLAAVAGNAVMLAVFGSLQKLAHAPGLFFGSIPSPQPAFFASFIYHNHWGAFAVLMTAVSLGLIVDLIREGVWEDFWHSPGPSALLGTALLAASIPLSTSRSCTVLIGLLLAGALVWWFTGERRHGAALALSGMTRIGFILGAAIVVIGLFEIARPTLLMRTAKTVEQVSELRTRGDFGSRQELYRDTWSMARDRLAFGWGLGSYPIVFFNRYNTQNSPIDQLPVFYNDAHSDWLQSLAEVGFAGTIVLGLHGLLPVLALRRWRPIGVVPGFLLSGCLLVLLYAWVEFPFGNVAVVIAWWVCFFSAIQYARIDHRLRTVR